MRNLGAEVRYTCGNLPEMKDSSRVTNKEKNYLGVKPEKAHVKVLF